ncbi:NAD(P)-dependent oxidoreductase [Siphonobacter sp. SORGH_AS_0500]|uniref:NAD-dependent epimerase/dehydratase family protein n=1 Tax=Siphonobacter sp. SORGH_AS_0500 TaxID=1864824 RepID=UPI000CB1F68C|nr:NAD(P)-dependent oxidoreductase [Siphonobacter sp. SORGH_AS_0500]MDR6196887.1 nucleoside-diphosphate-sugar epimerase [Siphonobacter sp. SORGH_AS_0500]PKK36155.1 NAD-dependent epimerase [Siphonobacter sp. SORGH_AS_0500]
MKSILITGASGFIGTNLVDFLLEKGYDKIINLDKKNPLKDSHNSYWVKGNIMNEDEVLAIFNDYRPDTVIHLAARTDTLSDKLEDYLENHEGTRRLLNVVKKCNFIERIIVTSTQYVYKSKSKIFPSDMYDFEPHTVYGQSKVLTEKYTHSADLKCLWTIIRPANIWGPWHMRYPVELWRMIDKGLYSHPTNNQVIRTYGYVKNIVHQIYNILIAPSEVVDKKTFYVGDLPIDSYSWLNEISMQLNGKEVKRAPYVLFKSVALVGDVLRTFKVPFPLYSQRLDNMIEDYPAPTKLTVDTFGQYNPDLSNNVKETINWLKGEGKVHFEYWNSK